MIERTEGRTGCRRQRPGHRRGTGAAAPEALQNKARSPQEKQKAVDKHRKPVYNRSRKTEGGGHHGQENSQEPRAPRRTEREGRRAGRPAGRRSPAGRHSRSQRRRPRRTAGSEAGSRHSRRSSPAGREQRRSSDNRSGPRRRSRRQRTGTGSRSRREKGAESRPAGKAQRSQGESSRTGRSPAEPRPRRDRAAGELTPAQPPPGAGPEPDGTAPARRNQQAALFAMRTRNKTKLR